MKKSGARFQFHSGSIKSAGTDRPESFEHLFQFHSGSIKSGSDVCFFYPIRQFQFHSGSIKRKFTPGQRAHIVDVSIP